MRRAKIINIVAKLMRVSGLLRIYETLSKIKGTRKTPILMYHSIYPLDQKGMRMHIKVISATPQMFERQMQYLSTFYDIIPLEEYVSMRNSGVPIPRRSVIVTFDDGYRDNYTHAYPILNALNIKATIFICPELIDTQRALWSNRLAEAIYKNHEVSDSTASKLRGLDVSSRNRTIRTANRLINEAISLDPKRQEEMTSELLKELNDESSTGESDVPYLSWEQIGSMVVKNISFGSHTQSHPNLNKISSQEARSQIESSRLRLESELDRPVKSFAYPFGNKDTFNNEIKKMVRDAGYVCACSTVFGRNRPEEDLYELKRIPIFHYHNMEVFRAKVSGLFDMFFEVEKCFRRTRDKLGNN